MSLLSSVRTMVRSEEDLATTVLAYVLRTHEVIAEDLNSFLGIPLSATWGTQEYFDDGDGRKGRPDLVARSEGLQSAFIEAKFRAGLTPAQPNHYLQQLRPDGLLVFLVPSTRLTHIKEEVLRRAEEIAAVSSHDPGSVTSCKVAVTFENGDCCGIQFVSWDDLLTRLLECADRGRLEEARRDLEQIRGLVSDIEGEAFVPFTSEQLTSGEVARINLQIRRIVIATFDGLLARGYVRAGYHTSIVGSGWTGVSVERHGLRWSLFESWKSWQRFGHSPIWLTLDDNDRKTHGYLLRVWLDTPGRRAVDLNHWTPPAIAAPLLIRPDADEHEVVVWLLEQVDSLVEEVVRRREQVTSTSAK